MWRHTHKPTPETTKFKDDKHLHRQLASHQSGDPMGSARRQAESLTHQHTENRLERVMHGIDMQMMGTPQRSPK